MLKQIPNVMSRLRNAAAALHQKSGTVCLSCAAAPHENPYPAPPRRPHPRRARRGLSLFEAVLVMMIAVPLAQQGVRLAEGYIRQQAGVQESRLLTQVVTAASTYALRDLNDQVTDRGTRNIQVLTLEGLASENAWVGAAARTSLGRDIQVIFYDTGLGKLVVIARAFTLDGENTRPYMPRGGIGIGLVGTITADAPSMLRGPGLNYDLTALQAQASIQDPTGRPEPGDQLAIAVLRMDQDVLPFLHRVEVPGLPALNQMQTDLDMGGFDLIGVGELKADRITISEAIEISELRGELEVEGDIQARGNLAIPGKLTSTKASIARHINAGGLAVTGPAQLGTLKARSVRVTGAVMVSGTGALRVTGDVTVDGPVSTKTLAAGNVVATIMTATAATIGTVQAEQVRSTRITSEQLVATRIVTERCTGC